MNETIYVKETQVEDGQVVLIPTRTIKTLVNTGNYRLIVCCNTPAPASNLPVAIQVGTNVVPLLCKYGNELLANQINKRVAYCVGYGDMNSNYENGQFCIMNTSCLNARGTESTPVSI